LRKTRNSLVAVAVLGQPGHLPGRDLQRGEEGRGAVPAVVMGALLGMADLHRQQLLGPVQRLDLGFLIDT
jgi:hypothetical protein